MHAVQAQHIPRAIQADLGATVYVADLATEVGEISEAIIADINDVHAGCEIRHCIHAGPNAEDKQISAVVACQHVIVGGG